MAQAEPDHQPTLSPTVAVSAISAVVLAVGGLILSRPDAVVLAIPVVLCLLGSLVARRGSLSTRLMLRTDPDSQPSRPTAVVEVTSGADLVQVQLVQGANHARQLTLPGHGSLKAHTRLLHSGPTRLATAQARSLSQDGSLVGPKTTLAQLDWQAMPDQRTLPVLPVAPRLVGLHGSHDGARPGHGGDFRDIHPFVPGDEIRRVDWKATARAARRPGELFVRRTHALSDASVVIVIDNVDDLGEAVATWGTGDLERSGVTSLDLAREAARSVAETTVAAGDRVAFHEITPGGRSVRSGAGARHLARVLAAIAATGQRGEDALMRRTPPIPTGSVVYVLSTFFDGAAAQLALTWRAAGHRVVAVDVLPTPDDERLSSRQRFALRIVMAERRAMFEDLAGAGIDLVRWGAGPDQVAVELRVAARVRR